MSTIEYVTPRPGFRIPRVLKGNWQIADDHSGRKVDLDAAIGDMWAFADAGVTAFVCGDIYVGVEARIGQFLTRYRASRGAEVASRIKVLTTYVPFFLEEERLRRHSMQDCEAVIDRSLQRLCVERLDLVQMHWWNFAIPGHVEMALMLKDLQKKGKIHLVSATNYDTRHLAEVYAAGVDVATHTIQYSLLDRRPENGMVELCAKHGTGLLCYGGLAGGFFSRKWLGIDDPGTPAFENVSLDKYYRIICDFGGWTTFQQLLHELDGIATKHGVSTAAVAGRWVLDRPQVAGVIIGARSTAHLSDNLSVFDFRLDAVDRARIDGVLARSTGPRGDVYELDRDENRDALEEVKTTYYDVEDGRLVQRTRPKVVVDEPYGHYLAQSG